MTRKQFQLQVIILNANDLQFYAFKYSNLILITFIQLYYFTVQT